MINQKSAQNTFNINQLFATDQISKLKTQKRSLKSKLRNLNRSSCDYAQIKRQIKRQIQEIDDEIDGHRLAERVGYTRLLNGMATA